MISAGLKKMIEGNALGFATIGKNKPHNIAVACVKVKGNFVVISNTHIKDSIENMSSNKNVSLVVWNKDYEKVCIGFEITGTARNYKDGKWFDYVCDLPDNKGYKIKSAIVVKIDKIKKLLS